MSQEHVELVRNACAAWGEGDISVFREMYAPDVVASGGVLWPEGEGSVRGADAIMSNFEAIMAAFERSELIPEGFLDSGDTLVVPLLWRGSLRGSDSFIEQRVTCAYRFKDGLIVYTAWFEALEQALDALGLPHSAAAELVDARDRPPETSDGR
jgi:ketosteroid isomerase-like protein